MWKDFMNQETLKCKCSRYDENNTIYMYGIYLKYFTYLVIDLKYNLIC